MSLKFFQNSLDSFVMNMSWQGFKDLILNPTKYMVALGELNVECAKSVLERYGITRTT